MDPSIDLCTVPAGFTLVAYAINITYTGVICAQHRTYRHSWDIPACWYTAKLLQLVFVQTVLFTPAFFFPKATIFLLYRQLFAINRHMRMAIDAGLLITLLTYLSNIPMAAIYGAPRAGESWESLLLIIGDDSRLLGIGGIIQCVVGTFINFYIFFLSLPSLLRPHLPKKRVLGLASIFSTALLLTETNVAIIVGCMPAFASFATVTIGSSDFFKSLRSRLLGHGGQSTRSKTSSSGRTCGQAKPAGVTYGERQSPRRNDYYKLSDTTLIMSQAPNGASGDTHKEEHEMQSKPSNQTLYNFIDHIAEKPLCKTLAALLGAANVLFPGSAGYDAELASYFSPQAAAVRPTCFVTPQAVNDVSATIKLLGLSYEDGSVAIRTSGHTWFGNANSAPDGITIDQRSKQLNPRHQPPPWSGLTSIHRHTNIYGWNCRFPHMDGHRWILVDGFRVS
ncbi:hypothetical protein DL771_006826 [Monosporascus sp. 5C6A]|nr:hypothetical protein DL771_006826 [Monosporascus sp. 5C6A]